MASNELADQKVTIRPKRNTKSITRVLSAEDQAWLDGTYDKLLVKMKAECERIGSMIPYTTNKEGKYEDIEKSYGLRFWTNGFWPGMLWQMYETTGDESYKDAAIAVELRLEALLRDPENINHDLGFLFLLSAVAHYQETGDLEARRRGLLAASILASRYNPEGRFIRAWPDSMGSQMGGGDTRGWMIIDCLMNLPLLYWASEETNDPRFRKVAINHAKTAQKYVARPDGSCNHIVSIDPETGEYLTNPGGQGYKQGSSWSRGQSWAVYGFALSYRHTGDVSFLETAKQCAHYCISNMAVTDWLPLVDYRQPDDPVKYDSTAGMITAAGLLEIAEHVDDLEKRLYVEAALRILRACDAKFSNWNPDEDSIVGGGTFFYHDPQGTDTHVPIIYGDYYLIEAVMRLKNKALFVW